MDDYVELTFGWLYGRMLPDPGSVSQDLAGDVAFGAEYHHAAVFGAFAFDKMSVRVDVAASGKRIRFVSETVQLLILSYKNKFLQYGKCLRSPGTKV